MFWGDLEGEIIQSGQKDTSTEPLQERGGKEACTEPLKRGVRGTYRGLKREWG